MINTTKGPQAVADSFSIRRQALGHKIPYYTLLTSAKAGIMAIRALKTREMEVKPLQAYFPNDIASDEGDNEAA